MRALYWKSESNKARHKEVVIMFCIIQSLMPGSWVHLCVERKTTHEAMVYIDLKEETSLGQHNLGAFRLLEEKSRNTWSVDLSTLKKAKSAVVERRGRQGSTRIYIRFRNRTFRAFLSL